MKKVTALFLAVILAAGLSVNTLAYNASPANYEYVLPMEYDSIVRENDLKVFLVTKTDSTRGRALFDFNGNQITDWYMNLTRFGKNLWMASNGDGMFLIDSNGRAIGFSTKSLPAEEFVNFGDDFIVMRDATASKDNFKWQTFTGNIYVYDTTGKLLSKFQYAGQTDPMSCSLGSNGLFCYKDPSGLCGAMDIHGNVIIKPEYDNLSSFTNGYAIASKDGKYGIIDKTGATVVSFVYDDITARWDDAGQDNSTIYIANYIATRNGVQSLIVPGTFAVTPIPDLNGGNIWGCYISDRLFYVENAGKYGVISFDGKVVLPVVYSCLGSPSEGIIAATNSDGLCGYVDFSGNKVTDFKYSEARVFADGLAFVKKDAINQDGSTSQDGAYIDKTGKTVIDLGGTSSGDCFSEGFASVSDVTNNRHYIDETGKIVMRPEAGNTWCQTTELQEGLAIVSSSCDADNNSKYGVIKYTGASPSDWAVRDVQTAINSGLVPDNLQKYYGTDITREDFCSLAFTLLKKEGVQLISPTKDKPMKFDDTDNDIIYTLNQLGIINGVSDNVFAPDDSITREEAAVILSRTAAYLKVSIPQAPEYHYIDENTISGWASDSVYKMYALGIMKGMGDGSFLPKAHYSDEQAVVTTLRLYDAANK